MTKRKSITSITLKPVSGTFTSLRVYTSNEPKPKINTMGGEGLWTGDSFAPVRVEAKGVALSVFECNIKGDLVHSEKHTLNAEGRFRETIE